MDYGELIMECDGCKDRIDEEDGTVSCANEDMRAISHFTEQDFYNLGMTEFRCGNKEV